MPLYVLKKTSELLTVKPVVQPSMEGKQKSISPQ